jgi:hypothetical protein
MTETPQTPPPPEPPPPGSGGATGQPASNYEPAQGTGGGATGRPAGGYNADQMKAAVQSSNPYDLGIMGIGLLVFLLSLFPTYYTYDIGGFSGSFNAWHGFFGWFAAVLALAGAAILAAHLLAKVVMPFPVRLTVLGIFAVALICVIIAGLTWAGRDTGGVDVGKYTAHGFTYWVSLILIAGGTALSFLRKDAA